MNAPGQSLSISPDAYIDFFKTFERFEAEGRFSPIERQFEVPDDAAKPVELQAFMNSGGIICRLTTIASFDSNDLRPHVNGFYVDLLEKSQPEADGSEILVTNTYGITVASGGIERLRRQTTYTRESADEPFRPLLSERDTLRHRLIHESDTLSKVEAARIKCEIELMDKQTKELDAITGAEATIFSPAKMSYILWLLNN